MTILNVNATRMELLRLKKRLKLAGRGHKLLKDKYDELMRQFMEIIQGNRALRKETEETLAHAYRAFLGARSVMPKVALEEAIMLPSQKIALEVKQKRIMNLKVPVLEMATEGSPLCYGFAETSGDLDYAIDRIAKVLPNLLKLAQMEKTIELLALEIESTRRRVNALEHVLIPNLSDTIRYITMKLSEQERSTLTRLMKVKDIVRKEA